MSILERDAAFVHTGLTVGHGLGFFHCLLIGRYVLAGFHLAGAIVSAVCLAAHLEDA